MAELQPEVRPPQRRVKLVWVAVGSVLTAQAILIAAAHAIDAGPEPEVTILPMPTIETIEVQVEVPAPPPPLPPPPEDKLGCVDPATLAADEPIGRPVDRNLIEQLERDERWGEGFDSHHGNALDVATHGAQIALGSAGKAWLSTDDGRTFRRVLADREVDDLGFDRSGTLFARSGSELGTRTPDGKVRWRELDGDVLPIRGEDARDRVAVIGDRVVWMRDERVAISGDRGRTWKRVPEDQPWAGANGGRLFAWRGALYQLEHHVDRCGIDDWPVWRLDPERRTVAHAIFHGHHDAERLAKVEASDTVGNEWTWRATCWSPDLSLEPARVDCTIGDTPRWKMLMMRSLWPVEGARTLTVFEGALIEVCERGARQLYRRFPFRMVDAVDGAGRPIVVHDRTVYRWSPNHGWRKLFAAPPPKQQADQ